MAAQADFNIRDLIRDVARANDTTDAATIAEKVAPLVPESALRDVLAQALRGFVRDVLHENRPRGEIGRAGTRPTPQARPVPFVQFAQPVPSPAPAALSHVPSPASTPRRLAPDSQSPAAQPVHRLQTVGGRKGSEIREAWQRVLEAPYATEHGHKKLGDFTYEDCQFVASQLDKQAGQLASRARGIRSLGGLLMDHDASTIRDLPAEVKMQALGAKS